MPGSSASCCAGARKVAAVLRHHDLRAAVQVAGAAVVAEAAPEREHLVERRRGQARHVGKALEKARVVGQHRGHLRLLQHDLGQPDAVRIARVLPRQAMTPGAALPVDDAFGKALWQLDRRLVLVDGGGSAALASGAEEGRTLALDDAPDGAAAAPAVLTSAPVHSRLKLELAGHAVGIAEVAQRRSAQRERAPERIAQRLREPLAARPAEPVAASARVDPAAACKASQA